MNSRISDLILRLNYRGLLNFLPRKAFLKLLFSARMNQKLDLKNPQKFNQKLQWLKLYDHNPKYINLVDKYEVKKYIAETIGEEYVIKTLGVWDNFDDINFDDLPEKFVLKCTHNSGDLVICKDKSKLDVKKAKEVITASLKRNYYWHGREWPYKFIKPRIIAEEFVQDSNGELNDYKFFCFDGVADNVMIVVDRYKEKAKFYHFSKEWKLCQYNRLCRSLPADYTIPKPENMDKMFELAEQLSQGIPHVRMDFYNVDGKIYFGEFTFYHQSGFEDGFDDYSDGHLGSLIELPKL